VSQQASLAAEVHSTEGQFLLEELALNIGNSLIYQAGTRKPAVTKREGQDLESR
jgi:hypothetical protein